MSGNMVYVAYFFGGGWLGWVGFINDLYSEFGETKYHTPYICYYINELL